MLYAASTAHTPPRSAKDRASTYLKAASIARVLIGCNIVAEGGDGRGKSRRRMLSIKADGSCVGRHARSARAGRGRLDVGLQSSPGSPLLSEPDFSTALG